MRTRIVSFVVFLSLGLMAQPLTAQVDLTDTRTAEEKWTRSVYLLDVMALALIGHGKSLGQTAEQVTEWAVDFAASSWGAPGSGTPAGFVRGMYRNFNLYPNLQFEVLAESEAEVTGRMNVPYAAMYGETGESDGVTLGEHQRYMTGFYEGVAEHLGLDMTHQISAEWITFTVKAK